jgi:hypothetical protein
MLLMTTCPSFVIPDDSSAQTAAARTRLILNDSSRTRSRLPVVWFARRGECANLRAMQHNATAAHNGNRKSAAP